MPKFAVLLLGLVVHPVGAGVHELVYGTPDYREEPTSVAGLPDGGLLVAGRRGKVPSYMRLYILRLDPSGDTLWTKVYNEHAGMPSVAGLEDGGFVLIGHYEDDLSSVRVWRFDPEGDTLWTRTYSGDYGASPGSWGNSITVLPDGGLLLTGIVYSSEDLLRGARAFLLRMGPEGEFRWARPYPSREVADSTGYAYQGEHLVLLSDGGVALAVMVLCPHWNPLLGTEEFISEKVYLLRLDSEGNPLWDKMYARERTMTVVSDLSPAPDGGVYILINEYHEGNTSGQVVRLTSSGEVLWERSYDGLSTSFVSVLPEGGCFVVGEEREDGDIVLMRLDSLGNNLWSRRYDAEEIYIRSGVSLPDGGIALVGTKGREDLDIYLMLLDPGELSSPPAVEEGLEPLPQGYSLGPCRPNPFNTKLFVPFSLGRDGEVRIKVFSSDGRLVRSFSGRFRASEKVVLVK